MARTVRSTQLDTRAARLRLKPRRKPYRAPSAKQGLHLGYRRMGNRNGTWVAFTYQGASGHYAERAFAQADDYSDADDGEILTYYQAMERLAGVAPPVRHGSPYSVTEAVADYLVWRKRHGKSADDARSNLHAYVVPYFGDRALASLTPADFDAWQAWALAYKPRGRLKDGKQSAKDKRPELPVAERVRRRKARLNRVINDVHAALERAYQQRRVTSREAWARLRKFRGVESARIARLTADEARRLANACPPDFRQLVEVALLTGCRYSELAAFRTRDFDGGSGTLLVAESKSGKPRRVPLTDEGRRLLEALIAGKAPDDIVLTKADGTPWAKSEQFRRIRAACEAANIVPAISFHALRHTTASLLAEGGVPLAFVAEVLGHADTRMVSKHYQHLAPSVVHDTIRAKLPTLGVHIAGTNVRKLRP